MADIDRNEKHLSEEQLVWHYYGEDGDSAETDLHLSLCAECRTDFETLKLEMKTIESWPIPERGATYGEEVWRALVRRDASIAVHRRSWRRWLLAPQRLAFGAALAAMLLVAFFVGRVTRPQTAAPPNVASSRAARERILAAALSEHLEESQRVLMEISNSEERPRTDIREEQRRAEGLLDANRLYRLTAEREGQAALASVLEDLERVLLDVAHAPESLSREELRQFRARVDDEGLLFKVRVLELRLRELQDQPIPRKPPQAMKG